MKNESTTNLTSARSRWSSAVDGARVCEVAQVRYSERDDSVWFAQVTEDLYLDALRTEAGLVDEQDLLDGLSCVYCVRATLQKRWDAEMQECVTADPRQVRSHRSAAAASM